MTMHNPHPSLDIRPECSLMDSDPSKFRFVCKWCRNPDISPDAYVCYKCGKDILKELRLIQMNYAGIPKV